MEDREKIFELTKAFRRSPAFETYRAAEDLYVSASHRFCEGDLTAEDIEIFKGVRDTYHQAQKTINESQEYKDYQLAIKSFEEG